MTNIFKNTKFLFPGTDFIISWKDKKLWEITDRGNIDWSDHVINWKPFLNVIRAGCEEHEKLTLDFWHDDKKLVFFNLSLGMRVCVAADLVIQNKSLKEEIDMDEAGMNRELTPEERIEQLEKEKATLELQIKNQEKYNKIRKIGNDLALTVKALQDSGFSRNEAMQIFMMTSMNTMILPFLGR